MSKVEQYRDQFYNQGYLVIPSVLSLTECEELKEDLKQVAQKQGESKSLGIYKRMFEHSDNNLLLFMKEPIVSIAEAIIRDKHIVDQGCSENSVALQTHVIHNNGIIVPPGSAGISAWHQDDPPHFILKDDASANVHLPVLAFTANYYLSDVLRKENGPTVVIPGSHLYGKHCPSDLDESKYNVVHCTGPAGSVVLFNCQVWHRGSSNTSKQSRYVAQVTYGRRLVGHKYHPFMNYQLPERITNFVSDEPRLKRLVGFLNNGPYG